MPLPRPTINRLADLMEQLLRDRDGVELFLYHHTDYTLADFPDEARLALPL